MPSWAKGLGKRPLGRKKTLGVTRGFTPLHASLPLAGRLVGLCCAGIEGAVLAVLHARQDRPFGRAIALSRVGHDDPRHLRPPLQERAAASLRRPLLPPSLHEHIQEMAVLIDRPPQVVTFAMDAQKDLSHVPLITGSGAPPPELMSLGLPEFPAPIPHGFVSQHAPALRHQRFDVPVAQAEADVQPHTMAHNLCRKPMALRRISCA